MKIIDCVQGTSQWQQARLGIITASKMDEIITPKELKLSAKRGGYMNKLLAEWLTGESQENPMSSMAMDRGTELEPEARRWYEFARDVKVTEVGFCISEDRTIGCSPDGLVGEDGGLEIKCPMAPGCVAYMIGAKKVEEEYRLQLQFSLYVTKRAWWDIVVYNPAFGGSVTRVVPDAEVFKAFDAHLSIFLAEFAAAKAYLIEHGHKPALVGA